MSELPTEHFEVHEVDVVFRAWLQAHGGRVVNSAPVSMESPGRQTWYYEATPGAVVLLEIDIRPDVLAVTAKLSTGRAGAAYTWNGDAAKLAAFNDLCAAIRRKYPPSKKEPGPRYSSNQWLIVEHLDKKRPLRDLQKEWLRRRAAKNIDPPDDARNSMRSVINEEKKRRR